MMQIVIEFDEKTYNDIKEGKIYSSLRDVPLESVNAIRRGTVLPKGHGALKDTDALRYKHTVECGPASLWAITRFEIECAPTIIEANKETDE